MPNLEQGRSDSLSGSATPTKTGSGGEMIRDLVTAGPDGATRIGSAAPCWLGSRSLSL